MGFFDKLKSMKDDYDRKETARHQAAAEENRKRQQALAEENRKRKQAEEQRERELYEKLENSELMCEIFDGLVARDGFGESQGSLDTNRRQILVGDSVIMINNYPSNILAEHIEEMGITNGTLTYYIHQKTPGILDEVPSLEAICIGKAENFSRSRLYNTKIKEELERLMENEHLYITMYSLDEHGYEHIDANILKKFATVLHDKLQRMYPYATFTEVWWNTHCAYVFEMLLPPKEKKSIF